MVRFYLYSTIDSQILVFQDLKIPVQMLQNTGTAYTY